MSKCLHRVAILALLAAGTATAQDARLAAIPDATTRAAVGQVILAAERQGLPREPLVTKALEGVEKGAPPARIETAVRAIAGRLATARTLLPVDATPTELVATADALAAGATGNDIRAVTRAAPKRSPTVAIGVLAQLTARGIPSKAASAAVAQLVRQNASHAQLVAFQRAVQDDLSAGIAPATAFDLRFRAIIAALPPPGTPGSGSATLMAPKIP